MRRLPVVLSVLLGAAAVARSETPPPDSRPAMLREVELVQNLDRQIPLDTRFRDETGSPVSLTRYFGGKPVVLSFAYQDCPMLCSLILDGLVHALGQVPLDMGTQYEAVNISIDPHETSATAARKKKMYVDAYGRSARSGWHFLTGDEKSIRRVTDAAGFHYAYDKASGQYAHPSGILVITPQGRVAKYFYGVTYSPRDLRLALVEAAAGRIGSRVDQLLLYCYHYDVKTGRYGLVITRVIQLAGLVTLVAVGSAIALMSRIRSQKQDSMFTELLRTERR